MGHWFNTMPKPNVAVLGYALFVTVNATSLWGGVFPFFPREFHTPEVTILFFMSQALAYCATFFLTMFVAYRKPEFVHKTLVLIAMTLAIAGAVCLIAAMYLKWLTLPLVVAAGVCLGLGCGGFAMAWQRYFSALPSTPGIFYLLAGTMLGAPVFFALYLVPSAVTVYLSPAILMPVCGLCAILATRTIDFDLPQFADVPARNPKVYALAVRDYWKTAVGIGSIGFASGAVRAVALADPAAGDATNIFSMIGSLAAALILLTVWRRRSFQFDLLSALKVLFPVSLTCLVLLPAVADKLSFIAGLLYMAFSVVGLIMLLQCAQASRDRGINPAFIFGFCGGIVYLMQDGGFIFGFWADSLLDGAFVQLAVVALVGGYVLALAFALQYVGGTVVLSRRGVPDSVEFVSHEAEEPCEVLPVAQSAAVAMPQPLQQQLQAEVRPPVEKPAVKSASSKRSPGRRTKAQEQRQSERLRDRVSKDCLLLQEQFKLSNRETEVAELIMRGNSVPSIAETLVISENTVRTHTKHIYTKLGIHKRQEMLDLVQEVVEYARGEQHGSQQ